MAKKILSSVDRQCDQLVISPVKAKLVTRQYGEFEEVMFLTLEELDHHLDQILHEFDGSFEVVSIQYPVSCSATEKRG